MKNTMVKYPQLLDQGRIAISDFVRMIVGAIIALPFIFVFIVLLLSPGKASGAVVITTYANNTDSQTAYNDFTVNVANLLSAQIDFRAGDLSGSPTSTSNFSEVLLNNTSTAVKGQYAWAPQDLTINDTLSLVYDDSVGRMYATAGSGSTFDIALIKGFNVAWVQLADAGTAGSGGSSVDINFNSGSYNLSAKDESDYLRIDFNSDSPGATINGLFQGGLGSSTSNVFTRIQFYNEGGTAPPVPEPSSGILILLSSFFLWIRRR